jgi:signal transduction histidine kinase
VTAAKHAMPAVDAANILLVDDQPARLLVYQSILSTLGQNLVCARSGVEALEQLLRTEFALVLLDVSMPGMDGFETAAMIHGHPRYERTPIIFVTGVHDTEFDRLKGYQLGAVDYVSIPVVPEILRGKVSVLVELHAQRKQLQKLNESLARANAQLELTNTTLQAERSRELEVFNRHLLQANAELAGANQALEVENRDRLRAELALKEADRRKDEFLAILAHELRNPLAPIRYAVEVMSRAAADPAAVSWSRDVIERQVLHLTELVDDLLDISRITRGTINLNVERLDVSTIVSRAVESIEPSLAENQQHLSVDCPAEPLFVEGDLTRLVQVLGNLLSNAVKFSSSGGRIELNVRRSGAAIELYVRDYGIGIASDSIPKLFTLFSRLPEGSTAGAHPGLGVGLALVRRLVEMHGGSVAAHSDGVGQGSEFVVRLPTALGATMPSELVPKPCTTPEARETCQRILIVDDNIDALEGLSLLLQTAGFEVLKASDGRQALQIAAASRPDFALLDIGMPHLDGYEVARRIRAEPWGRQMPLVALSGWGQSEDLRRTRESGFNSHLVKPVSFEAVIDVIARLARRPVAADA